MSNGRSIKRGMKKPEAPKQDPSVFVEELAQDVPPEKKKQLETAMGAITQMVYDPKTKGNIQQMLKSGEAGPEQTLPMTANAVFTQFESMSGLKNGKMPLDMKLALGVHTFVEVKDMGQAMGLIPEMNLEQAQPLMKMAMQQYIQKGLKDKSIDPIELQEQVEPLMSPDEKGYATDLAEQHGIPQQLNPEQANEGMLQQKMQPLQVKQQQLQKQNQQLQGALQGIAQKEN